MSILLTALVLSAGACSDPTGASLTREEFGVSISPATPSLEVGSRMLLRSVQGGKAYAGPVTWSVENPEIASVGPSGILTGVFPGETTVTASSGGNKAVAQLKVKRPSGPYRLYVDPERALMLVGDELTFTGEVRKGNGQVIATNVAWSSADPTIVSVTAQGVAKALQAGETTLTVSWDNLQAAATVTVSADASPSLALVVDPGISTIAVGDTATLTGELRDESGAVVSTAVSWSSLNTNVVTVDAHGHIKGVGAGETRVLARWNDIEQAATVTVEGSALSGPAPPVAADGEFVVFPNEQIAFIIGPQLLTGSAANPWPWFDENAIASGKKHGDAFPSSPTDASLPLINYYDQGLIQYANYYRTGDPAFLTIARKIADTWWESPSVGGGSVSPGSSWAPRNASLGGLMLRALDGRPEMWPWITSYTRYMYNIWLGMRIGNPELHYGVRDGGFMLTYTAWLAKAHPDAAVRAEFQEKALTAARDYYARLQYDDGSWRWGDSSAWITGKLMQPFMVGLMLEGMVATHQLTGDPAVANAIMKSAENLFTVAYRRDELVPGVADTYWRGMWYFVYGDGCMPQDLPNSTCGTSELRDGWDTNSIRDVRQLNPTTVHVFGYAYKISGDTRFLAMGDEIFAATFGKGRGPLSDPYYGLGDYQAKFYNQSYRSAGHYLAWRAGR